MKNYLLMITLLIGMNGKGQEYHGVTLQTYNTFEIFNPHQNQYDTLVLLESIVTIDYDLNKIWISDTINNTQNVYDIKEVRVSDKMTLIYSYDRKHESTCLIDIRNLPGYNSIEFMYTNNNRFRCTVSVAKSIPIN
jgi:hypothetical protein